MPNSLLTTGLISNTALAEFAINAPFIQTASRMYQADFLNSGYKVGDTIQIRKQNNFIVGDGSVGVPQSILQSTETLKIEHQYHAFISYTVADLTLKIADFSREFVRPAIQRIIGQMESDISGAAETDVWNFVGQGGVPINSYQAVSAASAKLMQLGVNINNDAYMVLSIPDAATLKGAILNYFTPVTNEDILKSSALGHLDLFDVFQSQSIKRHQAGVGPTTYPNDTLIVNGSVSSGNTIVMSGATASIANYFLPGDLFEVDGVYQVNKINGQALVNQKAQFVIQSSAASSVGGVLTLTVLPEIISDASNPNRNISSVIPNAAPVTVQPSYNNNMAYPSRGLDIVCPPLFKLDVPSVNVAVDDVTGLSLAVTQIGDIYSYQNLLRIDILCGFKWHGDYVTKVLS